MRIGLVSACLVSMVLLVTAENALAEEPSSQGSLDIGSRLELFVDDYLIESLEGGRLKLHEPRSAGKVLAFDQPWEGNTSTYVSILQDADRLRIYYRGSSHPRTVQRSFLKPGEEVAPDHPQVIAYAESRDGISWERPDLGIYEFEGSKANSIVWMDKPGEQKVTNCMYVFKDGNPQAPASERYKAVGGSSYPLVALSMAFTHSYC